MSKEIGPRERQLQEMRECRYEENRRANKKPSTSDLRNRISKIKPMTHKGGRRGR